MNDNEFIKILRECDGHLIPSGDEIKLKKGTQVENYSIVKVVISHYMLMGIC